MYSDSNMYKQMWLKGEHTHCHHPGLQIPGHFPADTLLDVSATHLLVFLEDYRITEW